MEWGCGREGLARVLRLLVPYPAGNHGLRVGDAGEEPAPSTQCHHHHSLISTLKTSYTSV